MRRIVMILIAVGMGMASIHVIPHANAAELFNTVKKKGDTAKAAPAPAKSGGDSVLFNRKGNVKAFSSSGLRSSKIMREANSPSDALSAYKFRLDMMNAYAGRVSAPSLSKQAMKSNQRWSYYSVAVQNANVERTSYALQLERERQVYSAQYAAVDKKISEMFIQQMKQEDAYNQEVRVKKAQDWETMKAQRRMALYGKQVDKAFGGKAEFSATSTGSGSSSSAYASPASDTIKRSKKVVKKSGTPRLFNDID